MTRFVSIAFLVTLISGFLFENQARWSTTRVEDRQQLWQQFQKARENRLPKTAIEKLKEIYESASDDQEWPEAILALGTRYLVEGEVNQPTYPYVIKQWQSAIPDLPRDAKPIAHVMLAKYYYGYFLQNRWRFQQRSQTEGAPSDDFETWDLARLLKQIDFHFSVALQASNMLKKTPIGQYDRLLEKGTVSDAHRPTLFDFVAFQALDFYRLDEQFILQQDAFDITSDSPIFSRAAEFLAWNPTTENKNSPRLRAVKLYQELLRFHENDDDKTAWLDADLGRLQFGMQATDGSDEARIRYQAALERFADQHVNHPLSSNALQQLASSIYAQGQDLVKAKQLAQQAIERFPDSVGGQLGHNLVQAILGKNLNAVTERVWADQQGQIEFRYKNIDKVWMRLIKFDFENWKQWGDTRSVENGLRRGRELKLGQNVVKEWSVDVPVTSDHKSRTETISVDLSNDDLASGCYVLACSSQESFSPESRQFHQISLAEIWLTNLAVVARSSTNDGTYQIQVVDGRTGRPQSGVVVHKTNWVRQGRNSHETDSVTATTDAHGIARFRANRDYGKVWINHQGQRFGLLDNIYNNVREQPPTTRSTVFFTDRSIYRPGQAIRFKGICIQSNRQDNQYTVLPSQNVQVALYDANQQVVAKQDLRTNEFGSFTGTFTAPVGRVTGYMRLQSHWIDGSTSVRVEEYKRPKFQVKIDKPDQAFRLGQNVKITGSATAYTGAAIDDSKVVWRVVRSVSYPSWYRYRFWYLPQNPRNQEIANGQTTTDRQGTFEIEFVAKPDSGIARDSSPIFTYRVFADVTDSAGETRSDNQTTRLGYTSLQASLSTTDWLTVDEPVRLDLSVMTLDGKPTGRNANEQGSNSDGKLKVYRLVPPKTVSRKPLARRTSYNGFANVKDPDLSRIESWQTGDVVSEKMVNVDRTGKAAVEAALDAGAYKAIFETTDPAGNKVVAELPFIVHDPAANKLPIKIANFFRAEQQSLEPGQEFAAVWGTGYDSGQAFVEVEHRGKLLQAYWTKADVTQHEIRIPIEEKHRGGLHLRITYVRENRLYSINHRINVPWSNKKLKVKWEHFVSKLEPGGKETWTAVVEGPGAEKLVAEFVAGMYDASLDAFLPHRWMEAFNVFYRDFATVRLQFFNSQKRFQLMHDHQNQNYRNVTATYRRFHQMLDLNWIVSWDFQTVRGFGNTRGGGGGFAGAGLFGGARALAEKSAAPSRARFENQSPTESPPVAFDGDFEAGSQTGKKSASNVDLSQVSARTNLNETAFFFPQLRVDDAGAVRIEFEIPEALTKWKFLGFAHDKQLRSALLTDEITTSKDLMVQPNPPRFLREGDTLEFSVKVSNRSNNPQKGSVRVTFADARTGESVDAEFGNQNLDQSFEISEQQSTSLYWKIHVPDFVGALTYKAVGATEKVSDGEQGFLPVLSKRILVTESLPLPIRGNESKTFDFESLKKAGQSDTLQSQSLTVQMTSNPTWYAVMALPYLMEYPHECSEQIFNRLYANALGQHIVNSDPRIERIFEQWRGTDALDSPLEKNDELRNVLIAESPWLLDAKKESQSRRDVGILFDKNRLNSETRRALDRLTQLQLSDGAWPWFGGGRANDYITLYVTTGFGRLRHLGIDVDITVAQTAVDRLDFWMDKRFRQIQDSKTLEQNNLTHIICLYLYGRSFFMDDKPVAAKYQTAFDYFKDQARQYWNKLGNRQSQGHVALALHRLGDRATPKSIIASLSERSLQDNELGMYWREGQRSWWWYRAPIETQALMIELYDEVANDKDRVEELKIWMLKQKQTQNWKTTKATADACYGLLLRGTDLLASDQLVRVDLGGVTIEPTDIEAGTGFYQQKYIRNEIKPEMGTIKLTKSDDGIAWGSVHWQYLQDVSEIKPYEGTPLTLKKGLYLKKYTDKGPVISVVDGPVSVGDELVTRVEIRVDRAMEFVHLKDYRGSGTEPVNVLSRYKYQDGLAYYESTRDTASHFFIDYLPRGTYVFQYSVRVQHRGVYETGIAELQCMYAPEFNSHSQSVAITVE